MNMRIPVTADYPQPEPVTTPAKRQRLAAIVIKTTAEYMECPVSKLKSRSRLQGIARVRQMTMFALYRIVGCTQGEIGDIFGRHKTDVHYAVKTVQGYIDSYPAFQSQWTMLESEIRKQLNGKKHD